MHACPIPLLPGPWRTLPPGRAAEFLLRLGKLLERPCTHDGLSARQVIAGLRAMPLSFYPGWVLVEGEATAAPGMVGTFDVLYGPGLMWLIDGESRVLNDLNAGRIPADLDRYLDGEAAGERCLASPLGTLDASRSGPDFLRFYCASVWGDEGPFVPVESPDSPLLRGVDARAAAWAGEIRPLAVRLDGADLLCEGLIAYGRSLFRARLRIHDGEVSMEDDTPVAADVLPGRTHRSPLRDLRSDEEAAPPTPRDGA